MKPKSILFLALVISFSSLACNFSEGVYRVFGPDQESPPDILSTELARDEGGSTSYDEGEDSSSSEDTVSLELSPEETLNSGTHTYRINGSSTKPFVGVDGVIEGEECATHQFTEDGVYYNRCSLEPTFYSRVGPNAYEQRSAETTQTLIYTDQGFEWHSVGETETHYFCTIQ